MFKRDFFKNKCSQNRKNFQFTRKKLAFIYKNLSLLLMTTFFTITFITMCFIVFVSLVLFKLSLVSAPARPFFGSFLLFIIIFSLILGPILTSIFGRLFLNPIQDFVVATKELSKGNFDIRLEVEEPVELHVLAESFNDMAQELSSLKMLRNDFVNNFSHEFKTPIVSIKGFAKLLKDPNLSEEERLEYLDIIIDEADRLTNLSSNILNLSNLEKSVILEDISNFNISEQLRKTLLMFERKWSKKNITMNIDIEDTTYAGNESMLNQVWVNIIDNAIKFTDNDGKISVNLMNFEDNIIVKITDNGIGMDSDTKNHIFEKFYQGDNSRSGEGNGLGMAMVQKIVELHKGEIKINSKVNEGTVVTVKLPKVGE